MSEPDDRELDRRIANLPRSISPERDLWTDIERRIAAPTEPLAIHARRTKVIFGSAISLLAVAAAAALLVSRRAPRPPWPWPSPSAMAVASAPTVPAMPAASSAPGTEGLDGLENTKERVAYRAAVAVLRASLAESRGALSSEAAMRIDVSLGVLDQAIEATERALVKNPDSAELKSQLWDEYQQKIDALTAVVDLVTRTS